LFGPGGLIPFPFHATCSPYVCHIPPLYILIFGYVSHTCSSVCHTWFPYLILLLDTPTCFPSRSPYSYMLVSPTCSPVLVPPIVSLLLLLDCFSKITYPHHYC
jgi:hypothetical protein